jgi:diacylglycerol kinase (ATP)
VTTVPTARSDPASGSVGRAVVVLNANAGRKVGLPTNVDLDADGIAALLDAVGIEAEVHATGSEDEAIQVVREAAERGPGVPIVAAGGDGTLRVVARTLLERSGGDAASVPALGILPLGSVMNVARSLGLPREPEPAAQVIAAGHVRTIDVGEIVGWGTFFEGVEVGLHAELFAAGAAVDEGDPAASLRAIRLAVRYRPSRLTLRLDEGRLVRTRSLVTSVSNGPFVGMGFTVAPDARLDDGVFDVRVFERFSRWELLRHFLAIAAGRRRYEPRAETFRSATVRMESAHPLRVRADGDEAGTTPVEVRVRRAALRVIAPAPEEGRPARYTAGGTESGADLQ